MSTTTTNYGLIKPALTDAADITAMNPNWDTIDAKIKKNADDIASLPEGAKSGTTNPTSSTKGAIGQHYINSATGIVFVCIAANEVSGTYTWKAVGNVLKSTKVNTTLNASNWSNGTYTLSNAVITATCPVELLPRENGGVTADQFDALANAKIVGGAQAAGSIVLKALGDTPTIDIPVTVIIRGYL